MNTKNVIIKFHHNSITAETLDVEQRQAHMNVYMWLVDNTEAIEDKKVVLMDDVLFSGRTIRAGLDAMMAFGRPKKVELMVLVDRRYTRHLPIQPDYVGKTIDSIASEKVKVEWKETEGADKIWLLTSDENKK